MTTIWVTTRFSAIHYWPNPPVEVSFLAQPHRHEFHVKLEAQVFHGDRELEFFIVKNWLNNYVSSWVNNGAYTHSCEQFADEILDAFVQVFPATKFDRSFPAPVSCKRFVSVTVSEDGENGATVTNCSTGTNDEDI